MKTKLAQEKNRTKFLKLIIGELESLNVNVTQNIHKTLSLYHDLESFYDALLQEEQRYFSITSFEQTLDEKKVISLINDHFKRLLEPATRSSEEKKKMVADAIKNKDWEALFEIEEAFAESEYEISSGPFPKSPYTYELETLTRKMLLDGDFEMQRKDGDDIFIFKDGRVFNWTKIRENADYQHIVLHDNDFKLYTKHKPVLNKSLDEKKEEQYRKELYKEYYEKNQKLPDPPINFQEMQAIHMYTSSLYRDINALMKGTRDLQKEYQKDKFFKEILRDSLIQSVFAASGLSKIPMTNIEHAYRGTLWSLNPMIKKPSNVKDEKGDFEQQARVQAAAKKEVISLEGFVSTSVGTSEAAGFKHSVTYDFTHLRGAYIAPISVHPEEKEFLIPPTQVQLTHYKKIEENTHYFEGSLVSDVKNIKKRTVMLPEAYLNVLAKFDEILESKEATTLIEAGLLKILISYRNEGPFNNRNEIERFIDNCKQKTNDIRPKLTTQNDWSELFVLLDNLPPKLTSSKSSLDEEVKQEEFKESKAPLQGPVAVNLNDYIQLTGTKGSNEGGFYKEKSTGKEYYIKYLPEALSIRDKSYFKGHEADKLASGGYKNRNRNRINNEVLATKIYELYDVAVPKVQFITFKDEKGDTFYGIASEKRQDIMALNTIYYGNKSMFEKVRSKAQEDFLIDVLLSNYDVVGHTMNNMFYSTADYEPFRLDTGSALRYLARGKAKKNEFNEEVGEFEDMEAGKVINTQFNADTLKDAGKVFKGVHDAYTLLISLKKLMAVSDEQLKACVEQHGFDTGFPGNKGRKKNQELIQQLLVRKEVLIKKAEEKIVNRLMLGDMAHETVRDYLQKAQIAPTYVAKICNAITTHAKKEDLLRLIRVAIQPHAVYLQAKAIQEQLNSLKNECMEQINQIKSIYYIEPAIKKKLSLIIEELQESGNQQEPDINQLNTTLKRTKEIHSLLLLGMNETLIQSQLHAEKLLQNIRKEDKANYEARFKEYKSCFWDFDNEGTQGLKDKSSIQAELDVFNQKLEAQVSYAEADNKEEDNENKIGNQPNI